MLDVYGFLYVRSLSCRTVRWPVPLPACLHPPGRIRGVCVSRCDAFFVVDDAFTHLTDGLTIMLGVAVFGSFLKGSSLVSSAQVFCAPAYFMNELKVINDEEGGRRWGGKLHVVCVCLLKALKKKKTKTILLTNRSDLYGLTTLKYKHR